VDDRRSHGHPGQHTVVITSTMARLADWMIDRAIASWSSAPRAPGTPPSLLVNTWMAYAGGALLAALLAALALSRLPRPVLLPAMLVWILAWIYAGRAPGKRKPRRSLT
jgi:hypothetical protein